MATVTVDNTDLVERGDLTLVHSCDVHGPHLAITFRCKKCEADHILRVSLNIREVLFTREWCERIHQNGKLS